MEISDELRDLLTQTFADALMGTAAIPAARRADLESAATFTVTTGAIACACGITGSTYTDTWDGTPSSAKEFARQAGESTASLVKKTKKNHHYAWLYSTR
jgi:hypothetical protein